MRERFLRLALAVAIPTIFHAGLSWAQPTGQWPMFHHDVRHTGRSPYQGSLAAGLK